MQRNFFYFLEDFSNQSPAEIGGHSHILEQIQAHNFTAPRAVCVPKNTLKLIAQANNLQPKVYQLLSETNFTNTTSREKGKTTLQKLIGTQRIPKSLADTFLDTYLNYLEESHVQVRTAHADSPDFIVDSAYQEAVVIDTLLDIWSQASVRSFEQVSSSSDHIHAVLFPAPLLLIQQKQAVASGVGYSFDLRTNLKNRITIQGMWGVFDSTQPFDSYYLDVATLTTVQETIQKKALQLQRLGGELKAFIVAPHLQMQPSLTRLQQRQLAQTILTLKQKHLHQIVLHWSLLADGTLIVTDYAAAEPTTSHNSRQLPPKNTKQIYAVAHNQRGVAEIAEKADGISIYNSGQLLSITGTHPLHLAKTLQKKQLVSAISRTLTQYHSQTKVPILYRSNQLTSAELRTLEHAATYEPEENNPYLGFRGGQKLSEQPQLLELELSIAQEVAKQTNKPYNFMLSFVRSAAQSAGLVQRIKRTGMLDSHKITLWLELCTPENMLALNEYHLQDYSGFVINVASLHTLTVGADVNNSEVGGKYEYNVPLLVQLITQAVTTIRQQSKHSDMNSKPTICIDLTTFNHRLFEMVLDLEIDGFVLEPASIDFAREYMLTKQKDQLFKPVKKLYDN